MAFCTVPKMPHVKKEKKKVIIQAGRNPGHLKCLFIAVWKTFLENTTNYSWTPNPNPKWWLGTKPRFGGDFC